MDIDKMKQQIADAFEKERILNNYNKLVKKFKCGDNVIDNRNSRKYQIVNIQRIEKGDVLDVGVLLHDSNGTRCFANEYLDMFLDNFEIVLDDDKERRREVNKRYYEKNKEENTERCRRWKQENREKWNAYQLKQYHKRKEIDKSD